MCARVATNLINRLSHLAGDRVIPISHIPDAPLCLLRTELLLSGLRCMDPAPAPASKLTPSGEALVLEFAYRVRVVTRTYLGSSDWGQRLAAS